MIPFIVPGHVASDPAEMQVASSSDLAGSGGASAGVGPDDPGGRGADGRSFPAVLLALASLASPLHAAPTSPPGHEAIAAEGEENSDAEMLAADLVAPLLADLNGAPFFPAGAGFIADHVSNAEREALPGADGSAVLDLELAEVSEVDAFLVDAQVQAQEQDRRGTVAETGALDLASLRNLSPHFAARLRRVASRMWDEHRMRVEVVEGYRTPERQQQLYAQGRSAPGPVVTWTRNSLHSAGSAADVFVNGAPVGPTEAQVLARIAREEGLSTLYPFDSGHVELETARRGDGPEGQLGRTRPAAGGLGATPVRGVAPVAPPAPVARPARPGGESPDAAQPGIDASLTAQLLRPDGTSGSDAPRLAGPSRPDALRVDGSSRPGADRVPPGITVATAAVTHDRTGPNSTITRGALPHAGEAPSGSTLTQQGPVVQPLPEATRGEVGAHAARSSNRETGDRESRPGHSPQQPVSVDVPGRTRRARSASDVPTPDRTLSAPGSPETDVVAASAAKRAQTDAEEASGDRTRPARPAPPSPNAAAVASMDGRGVNAAARVAATQGTHLVDTGFDGPLAAAYQRLHVPIDGVGGASLQVGIRPGGVDATIEVHDPVLAKNLDRHIHELRQALAERGLESRGLTVRSVPGGGEVVADGQIRAVATGGGESAASGDSTADAQRERAQRFQDRSEQRKNQERARDRAKEERA